MSPGVSGDQKFLLFHRQVRHRAVYPKRVPRDGTSSVQSQGWSPSEQSLCLKGVPSFQSSGCHCWAVSLLRVPGTQGNRGRREVPPFPSWVRLAALLWSGQGFWPVLAALGRARRGVLREECSDFVLISGQPCSVQPLGAPGGSPTLGCPPASPPAAAAPCRPFECPKSPGLARIWALLP